MKLYTDGSSKDGIGGWAFVRADNEFHISGKIANSTNNIAELTAILEALRYARSVASTSVSIFSDSQYCIKALTVWHKKWQRNGWITYDGEPVANRQIIMEILSLIKASKMRVKFVWVRGHDGERLNSVADSLAKQARLTYDN